MRSFERLQISLQVGILKDANLLVYVDIRTRNVLTFINAIYYKPFIIYM